MCPKPTVPELGPAPPTRQIAAPLPQTLKVVVMPLPEVVVGTGVVVVVMVVVMVGAEDGGETGRNGEVHKVNQTQTQNHHLHWGRRRIK